MATGVKKFYTVVYFSASDSIVGDVPPLSCFKTSPVPEFIDPVFAKTRQNARFLLSENERFGFRENWVYKFGHG
jgi:hypothetical protein